MVRLKLPELLGGLLLRAVTAVIEEGNVPFFRLADPLADRDVTLRDLLSHRTGLARNDNLWYRVPWSIEESVRRTLRAGVGLTHDLGGDDNTTTITQRLVANL